jgi:hypothetical protein
MGNQTRLFHHAEALEAARYGAPTAAADERHIKHVQMHGIARLRYRPRTARTMAFIAKEGEWRMALAAFVALVGPNLEADVTRIGDIKSRRKISDIKG